MKILTLTNLYPPHAIGGYEVRCQQTMQALVERGHEIMVLTSNYDAGACTAATPKEKVVRSLRFHGYGGAPWLPVHKLYALERENHRELQARLDEWQPEVVHVWNMGGLSKSLLLRLEDSGVPVLYDVSDHWIARSLKADVWLSWWNDEGSATRKILRGLARVLGIEKRIQKDVPTRSYRTLEFRHCYFCSRFLRNLTANASYPVAHGGIIHCAVDVPAFKVKDKFAPPKKLIWAGRLSEDKDPLTVIQAFALLRDRDLAIDIYGRGEAGYVEMLKETVSKLGLSKRIAFKQARHDEMAALYAQYDGLVFSSNWGEPFALTPLEGMAAGLPVIMCPDGGDAELAREGENCLMFTPGEPESLAEALHRFLELPDYGESLAQAARAQARDQFDLPRMIDQIEQALKTAVGG